MFFILLKKSVYFLYTKFFSKSMFTLCHLCQPNTSNDYSVTPSKKLPAEPVTFNPFQN